MAAGKKQKPAFGRGSGTPDPIDIQLGANLREIRISRGISQAQVAAMIGLTFQQIQKYERGTNRISVATLLRLCAAMNVSAPAVVAELSGLASAEIPTKQAGGLSGSRALASVQSEPVRVAVIGLLKAVAAAEE